MRIDYSNYTLNKKEKFIFMFVGYFGIFLLCLLFYHSIMISMAGGILVIFLLKPYKSYLKGKRKTLMLLQFKDLLYSLSASIATGRQMTEALAEAVLDLKLIYSESSPLVIELEIMVKGILENREKEEDALIDFAARSQIEDIRNFVDVYITCRLTGGDLQKVISNASEIIMEKMAIEKEIKSLTAQKQFEGKVITAMPLAVIFGLNIFSPQYLNIMYETFLGRIIMTMALVGIGVAYYITIKLTKIDI